MVVESLSETAGQNLAHDRKKGAAQRVVYEYKKFVLIEMSSYLHIIFSLSHFKKLSGNDFKKWAMTYH